MSEALGLAEHIQNLFPLQRLRAQRRHSRIEKQLNAFSSALDDARSAIRLLQGVVGQQEAAHPAGTLSPGVIAFAIPASELPLYRRALGQLQVAIRKMTNAGYELEAQTEPFPDDAQRFYRISNSGAPVLQTIAQALARLAELEGVPTIRDQPIGMARVLEEVDRYLAVCSSMLAERDRWLGG